MFWLILAIVGLIPSLAIAAMAGVARWLLGSRAPAFQGGLWLSAIASGAYVVWQVAALHSSMRDRGMGGSLSGAVVMVLPLMAAAVAALGFALGWAMASVAVEAARVHAGTTGWGGAALRLVVPLLVAAAAALYARSQRFPTPPGDASASETTASTRPVPIEADARDAAPRSADPSR